MFLFCQKLLLFFQSFVMIKNCCLQWIIQKAEIFYRENESNLNHQLQNESKNQDTRTVFIVFHFADEFPSVSYVCWKFVPVLIFTVKTLQTYQKSTLNFMLHWLGNYPQLHVQLSRVVTKISSCRVNTTSRRGIKRLGISFGSIFLLFSNKSSRGPLS